MPFEQFRFLVPGWLDLVEILIVAWVLYRLLLFLAGTRALQILLGLVLLGLVYFIAIQLNFNMISTLLGFLFTYGAFVAAVVFQPELRHMLARMGQSRAVRFLAGGDSSDVAEAISEAAERLSRS